MDTPETFQWKGVTINTVSTHTKVGLDVVEKIGYKHKLPHKLPQSIGSQKRGWEEEWRGLVL